MWVVPLALLAFQARGLPPEWEVRNQMKALAEHVERFQPLLANIEPGKWIKAPAGYDRQLQRVREEIGYLVTTSQALARQPDRLTLVLETYFRMLAVDEMLRSLEAGVRRYQNPAVADLLLSLLVDQATDREKLKQYMLDLAADREAQFRVADEEAQRCRALLSRQPQSKTHGKKEERR